MFEIHTIIILSILLGAFIGIAKSVGDPVMLLGGLVVSGTYYFLLLHNTLLAILKATQGR